ncbi:MAG: hypothetical protein JXB47_05610 [Anaerolineae bacterium]|nr:hypothetical protein [Anaerolineae bacterium]
MGEEDAGREGDSRFRLPANFPITKERLFSYFWGILCGVVIAFTLERPAPDTDLTTWSFFVIRIVGNAILAGLLGVIVFFVLKALGGGVSAAWRARGSGGRANKGSGSGGGGGALFRSRGRGSGGGEAVEREPPEPREPFVTKANFYGLLFGGVSGGLLVYNVSLPGVPYLSSVMGFLLQAASSLILIALLIGGLGYLFGLFIRRDWLQPGRYLGCYAIGVALVAFTLYYFGVSFVTPDTPLVGGAVSFCLILVPMLEGYMLIALFGRWRKEEEAKGKKEKKGKRN